MSVLLDASTQVLVHGASGAIGRYQLEGMRRYGTRIVGVISRSPLDLDWAPAYSTVEEAQRDVRADLLVTYGSGRFVGNTAVEAFKAGIATVVAVAEDVPMRDVVAARRAAHATGARFIGPNTNGIMSPGLARVGFFSPEFGMPGSIGVISRSGTLSYAALLELNRAGIGQSTIVGIGGGIARGSSAVEILRLFEQDADTNAVLFLGESGSQEEEGLAMAIRDGTTKPLVALLVGEVGGGQEGLGHAGAVIFDGTGDIETKRKTLEKAGATVIRHLGELSGSLREFQSTIREVEA